MGRKFTTKHTKLTKFKTRNRLLQAFFVYLAIFVVKMFWFRVVRIMSFRSYKTYMFFPLNATAACAGICHLPPSSTGAVPDPPYRTSSLDQRIRHCLS